MTELDRLRAACFALCAHVRDVHGVYPSGSASQVEAQHQAAHAREGTPWHPDAWRLPDDQDVSA
ncbi:MAG: hypothetical protein ACRDQ7_16920 [Haloechinothrix sp.]